MDNRFEVTVGAGTMMSDSDVAVRFPHRWTAGGVTVEGDFTWRASAESRGGRLRPERHLPGSRNAGHRSERCPRDRRGRVRHRDLAVHGHRLLGRGQLDASADQLAHLLEVVDQVAEIPQAIRAGASVRRVSSCDHAQRPASPGRASRCEGLRLAAAAPPARTGAPYWMEE